MNHVETASRQQPQNVEVLFRLASVHYELKQSQAAALLLAQAAKLDPQRADIQKLLALTAMEEPVAFDADSLRMEKEKVLSAVRLPADLAMRLARATVEGAGELLNREPEVSAAQLRVNVTSPAGTTAAALAVLQAPDGLDALMARAATAAHRRARELAG